MGGYSPSLDCILLKRDKACPYIRAEGEGQADYLVMGLRSAISRIP